MFGSPMVLGHLGQSGVFSNPAAVDFAVSLLILCGIGALGYGGWLLAKAPDLTPRVHLKPSHRRKKKRRDKNQRP